MRMTALNQKVGLYWTRPLFWMWVVVVNDDHGGGALIVLFKLAKFRGCLSRAAIIFPCRLFASDSIFGFSYRWRHGITATPPDAHVSTGDELVSHPGLEGSRTSVSPSGAPSSDDRSQQTADNTRRSPTRGVRDGARGDGGGAGRGRGESRGADSGSKVREVTDRWL